MEIRLFVKEDGLECPFELWLGSLRDVATRNRILARINRLRLGNFGDAKSLGNGLWGLRFSFGPGYRVYFGRRKTELVILLCGGDKSSQAKDIAHARSLWALFKVRHHDRKK